MDFVLQLRPGHGIQGGERFIHQDDGRIGGKSPGDAHPLLLTAGELGWVLAPVDFRVQIDHLQHLIDPVPDGLFGKTGDLHGEGDVFFHRQVGEQAARLYHISNLFGKVLDLDLFYGNAVDGKRASPQGKQLVDALQQGGLAASAGTDQNEKFAVMDCQRNTVQHRLIFVGDANVFKFDHVSSIFTS